MSVLLLLTATVAVPAAVTTGAGAAAAPLTLTRASYRDKTLAAILGQVGGVLTGYEYKSPNPEPTDTCFNPTYGPYSGDAPASCWTPNGYPGYDRLGAPHFSADQTGSDDDYHIDFFNQLILADHGPDATYQDIKDEWVAHDVGDWGPGDIANAAMRDDGLVPPLTGQAEWDRHYWLTEPYIENDTLGLVAPGMPATARDLVGRFGSVTGEFDSVVWAKLLGTMYSQAYFATDARDVLASASAVLPRDSWPYQVYQKVVALHGQNGTDWRWAQGQLMAFVRNVYGQDNEMAIPDRNNGSMMIAILYGGNDYLTTLKIASIIGNDADCTASAVAGLMGILKGMSGTPQQFKDRIYAGGAGRYVNDLTTGFPPNIKNDYPTLQSWDDLVSLYESNAAAQITARGGSTTSTTFNISGQSVDPEVTIPLNNYDFEQGTLAGWTKWTPGGDSGSPNAFAESNGTAQSGAWKGTVFTDTEVSEVKLYTTVRGLQTGATYRVSAFIQGDQAARLYADGLYTSAVGTYAVTNRQWVRRTIDFTATAATAQLGLHLPPGPAAFAAIDNLTVRKLTTPTTTRYEAESATRSGGQVRSAATASGGQYVGGLDNTGDYVQFAVTVPSAGEYQLAVNYASAGAAVAKLDAYVNGSKKFTAPFPRTESWGVFARDTVRVPVTLPAGSSTIRLQRGGVGYVELDYADLGRAPEPVYAPEQQASLANADFDAAGATQTPSGWGTWAGEAGTSADADFTEANGFTGGYRLTQYKASAYEVFTDQTVTGLTNGTYTLTVQAVGGGGQSGAYVSVKNYGTGVPELTAPVPATGWPNWRQLVISGITVTNNQLTIGVYSAGSGGQWLSVDAFRLVRQ
ncbi:CBM35 domain-containing protein [Catellatospora sp. KI3]|uniref:CBM35 domain-containing protein n=1 Tax=Catellatospora sp. KI3 TaxID=3041620 RepID=UPI0024826C06|nr:CBM35 domain-containing protein [Catellatospora sp. KI3]MDI1466084.1 CBM35 domain-containing protein [Catellatospora sp. KI3]